jgi:hypothetical protein
VSMEGAGWAACEGRGGRAFIDWFRLRRQAARDRTRRPNR